MQRAKVGIDGSEHGGQPVEHLPPAMPGPLHHRREHRLHRKFGFTEVWIFREYAVKNGHYLSSAWMQRLLSGTAS